MLVPFRAGIGGAYGQVGWMVARPVAAWKSKPMRPAS